MIFFAYGTQFRTKTDSPVPVPLKTRTVCTAQILRHLPREIYLSHIWIIFA